MTKTYMVPISAISNKFDVRTSLDEDRILQLAGCYESGMPLPPVKLVQLTEDTYAYVDGRHRGAAREFLNLTDVEAIIIESNDYAELFAIALEDNYGGSKPPTRVDIVHTIIRLLEVGATQTAIRQRLSFIAAGSLKAYISDARSIIMKRKISKALDYVGEGFTIPDAAKKSGVPEESLKDIISGKKGKWGKSRSSEKEFAIAVKAHISNELRSANGSISKKIEFLLSKVELGEVSYKEAYDVIRAWGEHLRKTAIRISDWKARLNAIAGEQDKVIEEVA